MIPPMPANGQIADAVIQTGLTGPGSVPAMSMATLYQSVVHSTSVLYENATGAQHQSGIASQVSALQGLLQIYSVVPVASALATATIAESALVS